MDAVVVAEIARVEVPATFWRKYRIGELSAGQAQTLTADFEADSFETDSEPRRFAAVRTTGALLDVAARS